jgi:hypothetical protein
MHLYAQGFKMPEIACQDYQPMALGCCRDHNVGKAWRLTLSARAVR